MQGGWMLTKTNERNGVPGLAEPEDVSLMSMKLAGVGPAGACYS